MRNIKHTIIAIAAIVMVGTLSFFQASSMSADKLERDMRLGNSNQTQNISIAINEDEDSSAEIIEDTAADTAEISDISYTNETEYTDAAAAAEEEYVSAPTEEPTAEEIEEKSNLVSAYAKVTGSTVLLANPSDEAEAVGNISGAEQVEILESTDGWYKVASASTGAAGYVKKEFVTIDKAIADDAALQEDHYKRGNVTSEIGVSVRAEASQESDRLDMIDENTDVIITGADGDYIKVLYGDDYKEGYVINTGLETTGEWVEKNEVHSEIIRIAEEEKARQAEEARKQAEAEAKAKAAAAAAAASSKTSSKVPTPTFSSSGTASGSSIVSTAMNYLGVPYVWGGSSPKGFDCSGFVQYVFRQNGVSLPRTAASQKSASPSISRSSLQPGDLVFFSNGGGISHVGIYIGNGNMVHAPHTGDVVKVSSINSSYYINHYAGAARVR